MIFPRRKITILMFGILSVLVIFVYFHWKKPYTIEQISFKKYDRTLLRSNITPNTIFTIWCGRGRWFEFHNYISFLSVLKELKPDNFFFYHEEWPITDNKHYNTWLDELKDFYPFFKPYALKTDDKGCIGNKQPNEVFIHSLLKKFGGGVYISEFTMLTLFPQEFRYHNYLHFFNYDNSTAIIMSKSGKSNAAVNKNITTMYCIDPLELRVSSNKFHCINLKKSFYPKDIWTGNDKFVRAVRNTFYGNPDVPIPRQSYDELIPNIAHIIWIGGGKVDYLFYLCVLSLIYIVEVEMVYVHGDVPPSGINWDKLKFHSHVTWIKREKDNLVFNKPVNRIEHLSDAWRVDVMLKYGGIYIDTDVIFVQPLNKEFRSYDVVASYDWPDVDGPFPDRIQNGVMMAKRNAPFLKKFQQSFKWLHDNEWSWNGMLQPYKIYERDPTLVAINSSLQVVCYQSRCHPTWYPDYPIKLNDYRHKHPIKNWRTDLYAMHFTGSNPPEFANEQTLRKANNMFGEMGLYILSKAGLLK